MITNNLSYKQPVNYNHQCNQKHDHRKSIYPMHGFYAVVRTISLTEKITKKFFKARKLIHLMCFVD